VALLQWCIFRGDFAEDVQLVGRKSTEWRLDPHHLLVSLALAVYTLLQAVRHELGFFPFAVAESLYFTFEVFDLAGANFKDALSFGIWSPFGLLSLSSQLMLPCPAEPLYRSGMAAFRSGIAAYRVGCGHVMAGINWK
jgi:hypothetical protein